LTLPKTTFNSDQTLRLLTRTILVRPTTPSDTDQWLQTTTNASNIDPLCTIITAAPLFRARTGLTITPANAPRRKQFP